MDPSNKNPNSSQFIYQRNLKIPRTRFIVSRSMPTRISKGNGRKRRIWTRPIKGRLEFWSRTLERIKDQSAISYKRHEEGKQEHRYNVRNEEERGQKIYLLALWPISVGIARRGENFGDSRNKRERKREKTLGSNGWKFSPLQFRFSLLDLKPKKGRK